MGSRRHRIGINLLPIVPEMGGMRTHVQGLLSGVIDVDPPEDIVLFVNREFAPELDVPLEIVETNIPATSRPIRYSYEQFALPRRARQADIDALHCPGYSVPLRTDIPTVVTIHDVNYEAIPETFTRVSRFVWGQLVPRSAASAAAVVAVSEFTRKEINRHVGIPLNKITVVPNAPSPTLPSSPLQLDEVDVDVDPPYLLYVGSTHPHKNHATLVRALADLPENLSLVLVGPERSAHRDVRKLVDSLGLSRQVVLPGFVTDADLAALYAHAELYVHPSRYEGFGIPVLEAMRYGTPVACSHVASLPEICGDAAVFFDPDSPAAIAKTCQELLDDPDLRETLIERGKVRVSEYSWKKVARQTLDACRSVLP